MVLKHEDATGTVEAFENGIKIGDIITMGDEILRDEQGSQHF